MKMPDRKTDFLEQNTFLFVAALPDHQILTNLNMHGANLIDVICILDLMNQNSYM